MDKYGKDWTFPVIWINIRTTRTMEYFQISVVVSCNKLRCECDGYDAAMSLNGQPAGFLRSAKVLLRCLRMSEKHDTTPRGCQGFTDLKSWARRTLKEGGKGHHARTVLKPLAISMTR